MPKKRNKEHSQELWKGNFGFYSKAKEIGKAGVGKEQSRLSERFF